MRKGIISLSFDDGRLDTYHVFKDILAPRELPGVVYIPTGYIETGFSDPLEIGYNGLMSRDQIDEIDQIGLFEIGAHGDYHTNDLIDVRNGAIKLQSWYPEKKRFGFASPHSRITRSSVYEHIEEYKQIGFCYVRGGRNFAQLTYIKRAISLVARITKSPLIFRLCYSSSINRSIDYYFHAIPIHKMTTLSQVKAIVDRCAKKREWAILEFHGIDKDGSKEYSEEFCWLEDDFVELCDYLKQMKDNGDVDVKTPIDIIEP